MGTEEKKPLGRIIEIASAVDLVGQNSSLDATVSYRLGRLGDYCKSPVKLYSKLREEARKEIATKQKKLVAELEGASDAQKREINIKINELTTEFSEKDRELKEQEEAIKIPKFKLSEFIAKEDTKRKETHRNQQGESKEVDIQVKSGQALVPVEFFSLMGDLIEDDKSAMS